MERSTKKIFNSTFLFFGSFALSAAAGFLLAGTSMAGVASFADISLAGGLSLPCSAAVLTGSLVHSILSGTVGRNIVRISAMLMIVTAKMFLEPRNEPRLCGTAAAMSVFVSGAVISALIGEVLYKLLFYAFYSTLTGFTSYSVAMLISSAKQKKAVDLSPPYGCAYAVVYTIAIAALCSMSIPFINAGLIAGTAVTLAGAYFYRHTGGVLCGALTVCGAFLASPLCGMKIVLLPAAGLVTGYLGRKKFNSAALLFMSLNFMLSVLTGIDRSSAGAFTDLLCGTGIFLAAAPYYSDKWVIVSEEKAAVLPEILSARMNFLSDSIGAVRKDSEKIVRMFSTDDSPDDSAKQCSDKVCGKCFRRLDCWKNNSDSTMAGLRKLAAQGEFAGEPFPFELEDCLRKNELKDSFISGARERAALKLMELRSSESRRLLAEQLRLTEDIVSTAGERVDVRCSQPVSRTIRRKLEKFGLAPSRVIACYNSFNRLLAEVYFPVSSAPESFSRVRDLISDELRMPLDAAVPVSSGREVRLRLFERPAHSIQVYGAALSAGGAKDNGDSSMSFTDGTGSAYVVLSDGMGSGKNAAAQSRLVVRMFRRLVSSGADYRSAIKLINSIMVTRSGDETFATLDALRVDLDTCGLTVIKSGAAATLIRRKGTVIKVSQPTFPIGIYEQSETFAGNYDLEEGDIAIMFSDGISENEYRFIRELLLSDSDLKKIVDEICRKASLFNPGSRSDDVTVIGLRITSSETRQ
ncbi:MAG: SpoIIE family protein phosphatase [Ruminococcus sp.]|nr:SpoIIE family protein phosphatase [Ruminococcus sp.]